MTKPIRVAAQHGDLMGLTLKCIRERTPFVGGKNTFSGSWSASGERFIIFSYDEPIAVWDGREWYLTEYKFSRTTSRHQSNIRRALSGTEYTPVQSRLMLY